MAEPDPMFETEIKYYESPFLSRLAGMFIPLLGAIAMTIVTHFVMTALHAAYLEMQSPFAKFIVYATDVVTKRGSIPYLELICFWLAFVDLVIRYYMRKAEKRKFAETCRDWQQVRVNAQITTSTVNVDQAEQLFQEMEKIKERLRSSKAGRRLYYALRRFHKTRSSKEVDDLLKTLGEMDASSAETEYTNLRFLTWLIPTLGFIGTVIGVGLGIAGFGGIIEHSSSFVEVQQAIPVVTHNLGIAFDTTLLALLLTAVLLALMSYCQKREEDLLAQIDSFCVEEVAGSFEESDQTSEHMHKYLNEQTQSLSRYLKGIYDLIKTQKPGNLAGIEQDAKRLADGMQALREHAQRIETALQQQDVAKVLGEPLTRIENLVQKSTAELRAAAAEIQQQFSTTAGKLQVVAEMLEKIAAQSRVADAAEFAQAVGELRSAVTPVSEAVRNLAQAAENLSGLSDLRDVGSALREAAEKMQQGGEGAKAGAAGFAQAGVNLQQIMEENKHVLNDVKNVMVTTTDSVTNLRDVITEMVGVMVKIQQVIQRVADQIKGR